MRVSSFVTFAATPFFVLFVACSGIETSDLAGQSGDGGIGKGDGSTGTDGGTSGDAGERCNTASDCGPNSGASCARVCADNSNPCEYACSTVHTCVMRGCPEDDNTPSGCTPACAASDICVSKQFNGGAALLVDDAGASPSGSHPQGTICVADPVYDCEPRPASCGVPFDCSCASSICTGGYQCDDTTPNEIDCVLDAP
jgi:hypothetical protein